MKNSRKPLSRVPQAAALMVGWNDKTCRTTPLSDWYGGMPVDEDGVPALQHPKGWVHIGKTTPGQR